MNWTKCPSKTTNGKQEWPSWRKHMATHWKPWRKWKPKWKIWVRRTRSWSRKMPIWTRRWLGWPSNTRCCRTKSETSKPNATRRKPRRTKSATSESVTTKRSSGVWCAKSKDRDATIVATIARNIIGKWIFGIQPMGVRIQPCARKCLKLNLNSGKNCLHWSVAKSTLNGQTKNALSCRCW